MSEDKKWAVFGSRSDNSEPTLCGFSHLVAFIPAKWWEAKHKVVIGGAVLSSEPN